MQFIDIFIKRPVLATAISLLLLVAGIGAAFTLNVRQYPKVNNTTITITTAYPGADPSLIQGFITTPIERSVASSEGIDYITSNSSLGTSTIKISLKLGYSPNNALTEISQKINSIKYKLPSNSMSPIIDMSSGNNFPSLVLGITSTTKNDQEITSYIENQLTPNLMALSGISQIFNWGGKSYALRVYMDYKKLAQYGLTAADITNALKANSIITAGGQINGPYFNYTINVATNLKTEKAYKSLIVSNKNGSLIRLSDVAKVVLGAKSYSSNATLNQKKAVFAGVLVAANANPLVVINNIINNLPNIKKTLPPGMHMTVAYNATSFIKATLDDVLRALIEAVLLVSLILFIFLGSFRSVIIPIVAIPLSLIGGLFLMMLMGFSINLLTLLAMVLAIGLVVDDAIIVLENIYRHIEDGMEPFKASIVGAREMASPVILMTLTLVAVYMPIGMLSGFTGSLFTQFAYSLAATVVISGIIAYTFSPMLCSKIITTDATEKRFVKFINNVFEKIKNIYSRMLMVVISVRVVMLIFGLAVIISCFFMFTGTKSELAPKEDQGFIGMQGVGPSPANINYINQFSSSIYKATDGIAGKRFMFLVSGYPSENSVFGAFIMKPWDERKISQKTAQGELQSKLNDISGLQMYTFGMPALPGIAYGPPVQFVLKSIKPYTYLKSYADDLTKKMMSSGHFLYAQGDLKFNNPEIEIKIDREKAASFNITMAEISQAIAMSYTGASANYFDLYNHGYEVIPELENKQRVTIKQLGEIYIKTNLAPSKGSFDMQNMIPLSSIVSFKVKSAPSSLNRFQQLNSVTISAVTAPGTSQGEAIDYMNKISNNFPKDISHDYSGASRQFIENSDTMMYAFGFAIIIIFLMLAAQFESFRDPVIILVTVPMAVCGALIPLYLGQQINAGFASINIYTQLGLVTLIGLISKHGILIVEFANKLQEKGEDKYNAIIKSASIRLRPVLMTTAATVCGALPLVYASGAGAVSRNSLGITIAAGMSIGTLFTLFVLPCVYMYVAPDRKKIIEKRNAQNKIISSIKPPEVD